ncbi:MAG: hypothetical protein WBQ20_08365 [Methyloceanibacter sp.]
MNAIAEAMMVATNRKGRFCSGHPVSDLKPSAARPSGQKGRWKALPAPAWVWTDLVMTTAWLLPGWNSFQALRHQLAPGKELQFLGDIGFGVGSDFTWQLSGGCSFDFAVWQTTLHGLVGYRALAVD